MALPNRWGFFTHLFRSKGISFRSSGFWSVLAMSSPEVSPKSPFLLTVQSHAKKTILQNQFCPNPTTPIAPYGDTQEAIASLCQTGQTYLRMLSCLYFLGAFLRWHIAADLETLLLTPLIRRGALQHASQSGLSSQVQAVPRAPHLDCQVSPTCITELLPILPNITCQNNGGSGMAWPSISNFSSPS